mgnify:CR=1 FL=1
MCPQSPVYLRALPPEPGRAQIMTSPALLHSISDWIRLCQRSADTEPLPDLEDGAASLGRQDPDIISFNARYIAKQLSRT